MAVSRCTPPVLSIQHDIDVAPKRWYKCVVAAVAELADALDSKDIFHDFRSS